MWAMTPTFAVIIVFLSWMLLCLIRTWSFPPGPHAGFVHFSLHFCLGRFFQVFYAFTGLYLLDMAFRFSCLGLISHGRFGNIAAPLLLCVLIGSLYILCGILAAPTRSMLLVFGIMASVYLYMTSVIPAPELRLALFIGWAAAMPLTFFEIVRAGLRLRSTRRSEIPRLNRQAGHRTLSATKHVFSPPAWDLSNTLPCSAGGKTYAFILALIGVEFVLQFEGMTLFLWI